MTHKGFGFFEISFPCANRSFAQGNNILVALLYGTVSDTEANVWEHFNVSGRSETL